MWILLASSKRCWASFEIVFAYPLRVGVFSNNGRRVVRSGSVGAEVLALLAEVTQHLKEHVIRFCVEARRLRHFYTLGFCLQFKCWTSLIANMMHEVRQYDELLDLSNEHGFPLWAAGATVYRGVALSAVGEGNQGVSLMTQA
jgi:hypothetical protein